VKSIQREPASVSEHNGTVVVELAERRCLAGIEHNGAMDAPAVKSIAAFGERGLDLLRLARAVRSARPRERRRHLPAVLDSQRGRGGPDGASPLAPELSPG